MSTALIAPDDLIGARRKLGELTRAGVLFEIDGKQLRCNACAHRCVLQDGSFGACGVRQRKGNELFVPHGYVARKYLRAVESNTIFHVLPGARALTFGMYGCDLRCPYCHNWKISQALRAADAPAVAPLPIGARELSEEAVAGGASVLCAAYNEPMISAEWVHEVFAEAQRLGLLTAVISDGNGTPEALSYLRPVCDVFRVDLKTYDEAQYHTLGGRLGPVIETIAEARRLGYWVEVVTLVVPGFNDDPRGIRRLADTLRAIDPALPWHLNGFQPRYLMTDRPAMAPLGLVSLAGIGLGRGLEHVYVGNVATGALSSTRCAGCHEILVERREFECLELRLVNGACPRCSKPVPGIWEKPVRSATCEAARSSAPLP